MLGNRERAMDKNRKMFEQFSKRDIEVLQIIALICVGLVMLFFRNSGREIKLGIFIITQFILPFLFSAERESKKHSSTFLLLFMWIGLFFGWWMAD